MSNDGVNKGRRTLLIATTALGGGVAAVGIAVPFVKSWQPSEKAKAAGAPAKADVSKIEVGQMVVVEWRGKPVYLVKRSEEVIQTLETLADRLKDPSNTNAAQQPEYANNTYRSRKAEVLVLEGVCTHLGCAPKFFPEVKPEAFDSEWKGGFFCPCHGSRFDLAGRVFNGSPAAANLKVPPYGYLDDNTIIIGEDGASA